MEQQAWILRSILSQLESQVDEGAPNGIADEFARLKTQSTKYRIEKIFTTKAADKQENIKKNRYKDIVPFDHTRVKLSFTTSKKDTDYINASFIKGVSGSRAYIATQGPLSHTLVDFLRMIWEYNIKVIVMSCREFEMGKKKCEVYWPQKQDDAFVCEAFTVHCDSEEIKGDYLARTLRLTYRNCSRTLKQLHYFNWPDHGVPDTIPPILDMLHEMRCYQAHDDIPICIHCSAGCGRTGALCVIDYTWNLLRSQKLTSDFNIYNLVQDMRTQRPSVVQTKEQYLLVYRTIRELFQRYLQTLEPQNCHKEETLPQSAIAEMSENDSSDQSEEFDLTPHHQDLLDEESSYLQNSSSPLAQASENLTAFKYEDMQWGQEQYNPFHTIPEALNATQGLLEEPRGSSKLLHTNHTAYAASESILNIDDISVMNSSPLPAVPEAVCLMVEDPYFDTPMSSPSSKEAVVDLAEDSKWTSSLIFHAPSLLLNDHTMELSSPASVPTYDEAPPPLPERTPESFFLAEEAELPDQCERLSVICPPNAAAEPIQELEESAPSPVPPLPERTPESFELATDPVLVAPQFKAPLAVNLGVIGLSSEWSGTLKTEELLHQDKTFVRSKSLRAKMTFSAPASEMQLDQTNVQNYCPTQNPLIPPHLPPHSPDSLASPIAKRASESFPLPAEDTHERNMLRPHSMGSTHPLPRVGMSSEWDGSSQPRKLLDAVKNRSKSVRAKSSRSEPLSVFPQFTPLPVVAAEGGSAQVEQDNMNRKPSLNSDRSGNKADKSNDKGMLRTKSLKIFRHKLKPKTAPAPPPTQAEAAPPSHSSSFNVFKFGFGSRFGKPKGPRSYPETWI